MKNAGDYIGNYRILALAKTTPFSELYVVEHTFAPAGPQALQLWPGVNLSAASAFNAFFARSRALALLQDPTILSMKTGDIDNDNPYLIMGYEAISYEPLSLRLVRLEETEPLPDAQGQEILAQIGRALVVAHGQGIVHGQVLAENVLMAPDGQPLLANFSLPFAFPNAVDPGDKPSTAHISKLKDQADLARLAEALLNKQDEAPTPEARVALARAMQSDPGQRFASVRAFLQALGITVAFAESPLESVEEGPTLADASTIRQAPPGPASQTTSPNSAWSPPPPPPPPPVRKKRRPIALSILLALVIIVLVFYGGNALYMILPAMSATVTLVPIRQAVQQPYTFTLAQNTDFAQKQVSGRLIKYTTSTQHKTVPSSLPHGHIDAIPAHGKLVFSSVSNDVASNVELSLSLLNGLILTVTSHGVISSQHATTVSAEVDQAGAQGNFSSDVVDGTYDFHPIIGNPAPFTAFVSNPGPFTGGKDAYNGPIIQQQDIDDALSEITSQLQNESQQKIHAQLLPNEDLLRLSGGDAISCTPKSHADHKAGAPGARVTVTEQLDCQAMAYDAQATLSWVQSDMQQLVQKNIGAHFGRVGALQTTTLFISVQGGLPMTFQFTAHGEWSLQFDSAGKQAIARAISGLEQTQARNMLLRTFRSKTQSMVLSTLWGKHLPTDISAITIAGLASLPPGSQ